MCGCEDSVCALDVFRLQVCFGLTFGDLSEMRINGVAALFACDFG